VPGMTNLPSTVTAYLDQPAIDQFTADASVTDEGRTHRGAAEIQAWLDRSASEWTYTTERTGSARVDDDRWTVTNHLEGDFPGGVVDLVFRFTLREGRIAELVIAP
jgi:hypothetical protein